MRWSTYLGEDGIARAAVWAEDRLHPVPGPIALLDLLGDDGTRLREAADRALREPGVDPTTIRLAPPVPRPPSIRDFMAFEEHVVTASAAIGLTVDPLWYRQPVFYFTNPASLRGAHDPVAVFPGSRALDYELEVAAVIGRGGADLSPDEAIEHIAGYVLFCDWSARDLQGEEMKLNLGPAKGKDSASSCGPWMLTADELPAAAAMTASVNGRPYSAGRLDALYWSFAEMIAYASRGTRVVPGDLIGSGTVGTGCILELSRVHGPEAYPWLVPGDRVRLEVDGLGAIDAAIVEGVPVRPLRTSSPTTQEAPHERSHPRHHRPRSADAAGGVGRDLGLRPTRRHLVDQQHRLRRRPAGRDLIDSCSTERRTRAFATAIGSVTPAPVRTLVNTHHHGDHTWGNGLFRTATIVPTSAPARRCIAFGPPRELPFWENPRLGLTAARPAVPHLHRRRRAARRRPARRGPPRRHTRAHHQRLARLDPRALDAVLRRPGLQRRHAVPAHGLGRRRDRRARERRRAARRQHHRARPRTGLPRPGPIGRDAGLPALRPRPRQRGHAAGVTPLQAARDTDLGRFADWPDAERIVGNLHRAYAELDGAERGARSTSWPRSPTWSLQRRHPLTCLA